MKTLRLISAIFLILFLNSCITTNAIWKQKYSSENFKKFFVDEENNRIVLIGEIYHYEIDGKTEIENIFKLGIKSGDIKVRFDDSYIQGSKTNIEKMWIGFDKKKLSKTDIEFLHQNGYLDTNSSQYPYFRIKDGQAIQKQYTSIKMSRYPSSKEKVKNYQPVSLEFYAAFKELDNPLQKTGKVILTPFAVVTDIIIFPYVFYRIATGDYR